ncbi:MAG: hypothetical protein EOO70_09730 [Myxococcaceae bacterium]|nr:MAG: hypothetical protein EOO70_09730 [Myxococcaceae bacterium]
MHAQLFTNLKQAEGREVMMTVRTLVDRYDAIKAEQGAYGAEGSLAVATLDERKFTPDVVDEARELLTKLGVVEATPQGPLMTAEERAALDKAEADLWAWYREWSAIARQAVTQPRMLQVLGLGPREEGGGRGARGARGVAGGSRAGAGRCVTVACRAQDEGGAAVRRGRGARSFRHGDQRAGKQRNAPHPPSRMGRQLVSPGKRRCQM